MDISEANLQRFEQLRSMAMIASATAQGLLPDVQHWLGEVRRLTHSLTDLQRRYGQVTADANGAAYLSQTRKVTTRSNSGHRVETYETVDDRREELDPVTKPIFAAQQRLAQVREQHAQAAARSGQLRQAVDEARAALVAAGWREER